MRNSKSLIKTTSISLGCLLIALPASATYVGNDPINATDPFGKQAVTTEEQRAVDQGNLDQFWQSRTDRGDPIGQMGVDFGKPGNEQPLDVMASTGRLKTEVADNVLEQNNVSATDMTPEVRQEMQTAVDQGMQDIRQDLAEAHIDAVNKDASGQKQFLSARQITVYHHDVFKEHNIPSRTFGGTPATGLKIEDRFTRAIWCSGCDKK